MRSTGQRRRDGSGVAVHAVEQRAAPDMVARGTTRSSIEARELLAAPVKWTPKSQQRDVTSPLAQHMPDPDPQKPSSLAMEEHFALAAQQHTCARWTGLCARVHVRRSKHCIDHAVEAVQWNQ